MTSLLRTVLDIARSTSYENVVVVIDHVLHQRLLTVEAMRKAFADWPTLRGMTKARRALRFASAAAESPGESVSRVRIDDDGFPPPVLQQPFHTSVGSVRVDFWWPRAGVVGEFDGMVKYRGPDDVAAEKRRHNAIAMIPGVRGIVRWGWAELHAPGRLQQLLRSGGLPPGA